ncbi:addiction module protein [Bathymodiolus septemdierum thioautotrophic gill symbiont]|uniref:Addiction module component n=1 Tax=endosymbiont of Bathymodiolus septemdierum str. Myojin knoll TaxID=1303921 RepID=A0A0P0USQ1_9GAMM|nr:addiction module protein [Bathymodiolus septemdierum thioautotrophic gill symbiont]BAS68157.1 conserved hypothetical protein [endosymbiont of Bathymodiolus septemdierum str. Myojin knoll]
MITISPENMTVAEKLSAMEVIWNDLCQHSSFESPDWHKTVLSLREQQRAEGSQPPMNWEKAKQQIRNKVQ